MSTIHKTFISFHHKDNKYKEALETDWGDQFGGFISKSVSDGDINPTNSTEHIRQIIRDKFISDATVVLVLVGRDTWRRKYVDWEISSGISKTKSNSRTGLLGLVLPTYFEGRRNDTSYNPHTIPPRLYDNIKCGFAEIYPLPKSPDDLRKWIHDAFQRRDEINPDNSRRLFSNNRSEDQASWQD